MSDRLVFLRLMAKQVAKSMGCIASFMPKPFEEEAGNGMHVHCSVLDDTGTNIFDDGTEIGTPLLLNAIGGLDRPDADHAALARIDDRYGSGTRALGEVGQPRSVVEDLDHVAGDVAYGTGALLGRGVKRVKNVFWREELGLAQAMWLIEVENFGPFIVESDLEGNSLFERENAKIAGKAYRVLASGQKRPSR